MVYFGGNTHRLCRINVRCKLRAISTASIRDHIRPGFFFFLHAKNYKETLKFRKSLKLYCIFLVVCFAKAEPVKVV